MPSPPPPPATDVRSRRKSILTILFVSLVLDLLSFTLVLPLFPHLIAFYRTRPSPLLDSIFTTLNTFKTSFSRPISSRYDTVLLGGCLGSLFSLLQALASPLIGRLSDRHGRRNALLFSMAGNITACLLWVYADTFAIFLASRIVGGLTEGNVQLAMAIASDISTPEERTGTMALVGVAFSVAFTVGPGIGAALAGRMKDGVAEDGGNPFWAPAMGALGLVVVETVWIWWKLPETRPVQQQQQVQPKTVEEVLEKRNAPVDVTAIEESAVKARRFAASRKELGLLRWTHFLFLLIFSGMEFSLPFMTYDLFSYTSKDNGKMLGYIGLIASLLQGGVVRRLEPGVVAKMGLVACAVSFAVLSRVESVAMLYLAATTLAVTSATVVTGLTSLASLRIGEMERGAALGGFRSAGQIGRASGPLLFCSLYWWAGRTTAYSVGCAGMVAVCAISWRALRLPEGTVWKKGKKAAVVVESGKGEGKKEL